MMELSILKKKLSTFRTEGGLLKNVSDELLMEILHAWENWEQPSVKFYSGIGTTYKRFASLLGKAKKLKREGYRSEFEEIKIEGAPNPPSPSNWGIELVWENNRVIRFGEVDLIIDFLKKAA